MTDHDTKAELLNRASVKHSYVVMKPFGPEEVHAFADVVVARRWKVQESEAPGFAAYTMLHDLSEAQCDLFARLVNHVPRARIAAELGITENTLKGRITKLRVKLGVTDMHVAYERMTALGTDARRTPRSDGDWLSSGAARSGAPTDAPLAALEVTSVGVPRHA